jgi:radical SAM superfamily enzyme YgiQ (UPF0313 family)
MKMRPSMPTIYEGIVWRPPSEADSLILQATIGCSWNKCTFCAAYLEKDFRIKPLKEVEADIRTVLPYARDSRRIFLADGNALCIPTEDLLKILKLLDDHFPSLERVGIYGGPNDIAEKSVEELRALKEAGLGIVYLGLESGSEKVLKMVRKGVGPKKMIEAGRKVRAAGLALSAIIIQGLGGRALSDEHARETAKVLNQMDPEYVGALTLIVCEGTQMEKDVAQGKVELLSPKDHLKELRFLVEGLDLTNCIFRANHPSNYITFRVALPKEKKSLLAEIDRALDLDEDGLRPEWARAL